MNFFDFPPFAAVLDAASAALGALGGVVSPGIAIVLVTIAVRAALVPLSLAVVRAEGHRRRIAPQLARLRTRYAKQPERLRNETLALYAAEKISPIAGFLPGLAQAPVLTLVYALFTSNTIAGHANALLHATLFGAPLGRHLIAAAGGVLATDVVAVALIVIIALIAWLSRRAARSRALPLEPAQQRIADVLSYAPFLTVAFAAVVPLAATLYLALSTAWTLIERQIMRRAVWTV
ncbi:MAG TPA: membrane protein insertase YidC [Pseudolysinimonas sp.]|nr:membrane protein insertase YidC [Pseudolysinimonas sp.]